MSITGAISNALTGLRANTVAADVIGTNLANALNENYARRDVVLEQNSASSTGGVRVLGVSRTVDPAIQAAWRTVNTKAAGAGLSSQSANRIFDSYGLPDDPASLQASLTKLETALVAAETRPDIDIRLSNVGYALSDLVGKIRDIGNSIQKERNRAESGIQTRVQSMNASLGALEELNAQVAAATVQGRDTAALLDKRDALVDNLSTLADIRVFERSSGAIAIYSAGGVALLDGLASEVAFETSGRITATASLQSGDLNQITVNGEPVSVGATNGRLLGGELGALFDIRDGVAVEAQSEIDAFAFELASRLNDPSFDPSRSTEIPGLLTDAAGAVDPVNLVGLSSRLSLNSSVDPLQGGNERLLRAGMLSGGAGESGDTTMLAGLRSALSDNEAVFFGSAAGLSQSIAQLAGSLSNRLAGFVTQSDSQVAVAQAQKSVLDGYKAEGGVNSDVELQRLMLVEKAYAANAQVIRVADEMLDSLFGAI